MAKIPLDVWIAARDRARQVVRPGDRITRRLCCGRTGTFTFTHWDGNWMAGATVHDCAAQSVLKINGRRVNFLIPTTSEREAWKTVASTALSRAQQLVSVGSRISYAGCGGIRGTFTFTHWEDGRLNGKSTRDVHPMSVIKIDGLRVELGLEVAQNVEE